MQDPAPKPKFTSPIRVLRTAGNVQVGTELTNFRLDNVNSTTNAEIILDYGRCEGGLSVFSVASASAPEESEDQVPFQVTYSETIEGIDHEHGDGPFFLFSNAMDSYRSCLHHASASNSPQTIKSRHIQASQRYQKITLLSPNTTITFSSIGFEAVRPEAPVKAHFHCSNETINRIWKDGVRTVDLCTVESQETVPAWDVVDHGTRVHGGHWAPCRQGTRWTDKRVTFETKIEKLGASWGVHMVANGLIFCLDGRRRKLAAYEGLSHQSSVFPVKERGKWDFPGDIDLDGWVRIETLAVGNEVTVTIQGHEIAKIENLKIHSILGHHPPNTGSLAFGGPPGWIAVYRDLRIETPSPGSILYQNSLLPKDSDRTFADFQVGTNNLACIIDGAKRDRACFGGDAFVTGRSIAYSTANLDAWKGSIQLLLSHQAGNGYLGNLCPIQAPEHSGTDEEEDDEPPTYGFYSLTYALLLVVTVKDYYMHSGDKVFVETCRQRLERQMEFTKGYLNSDGLVDAPPHLSMTWFPMGGPIFGPSAGLNMAYYDALNAMALLSPDDETKSQYLAEAQSLKDSLIRVLWNNEHGILRPSLAFPVDGCSQDINAYATTLGITPSHSKAIESFFPSSDSDSTLPPAFRNLGPPWDKFHLTSPYASGFALEALFTSHEGIKAVDLLLRVWGAMANPDDPNYSGAHWEAMKNDGTPFNHDVSLAHGWSTWPVFILPRYLAGVFPLEAGWEKVRVEPVLAGVDEVEFGLESPRGYVKVGVGVKEQEGEGTIRIIVPEGVTAVVKAPRKWVLDGDGVVEGDGTEVELRIRRE